VSYLTYSIGLTQLGIYWSKTVLVLVLAESWLEDEIKEEEEEEGNAEALWNESMWQWMSCNILYTCKKFGFFFIFWIITSSTRN